MERQNKTPAARRRKLNPKYYCLKLASQYKLYLEMVMKHEMLGTSDKDLLWWEIQNRQ